MREKMEIKNHERRELIRTSGAAAITGLSISTLNKLRCAGDGPAFLKLGRAVRYDRRDLDQWLDERRRKNTSEALSPRRA